MIALLPMRAMAAVTVGFCAMGHQVSVVAAHGDLGQGAASPARHGSDDPPVKPATATCSTCVEHCSSAAFAPSARQAVDALAVAQERVFVAERVAPAVFPDQLDRPPLAPLR